MLPIWGRPKRQGIIIARKLAVLTALLVSGLALSAAPALAEAPSNDDFANAQGTAGTAGAAGTNVEATRETGEPDHLSENGPAVASVWYSWTPPEDGNYTIDVCDSDFDTVLAVYTGTSVGALELVGANDDGESGTCGANDGDGARGSSIALDLQADTVYRIAVAGYPPGGVLPSEGEFTLNKVLTPDPPPPGPENDAPGVTELIPNSDTSSGSNENAAKFEGEPDHAGDPGGHSLWYYLEAPSGGTVTLDTCASGIDTVLAVYTANEANGFDEVTSDDDGASCDGGAGTESSLSFPAEKGRTYHIAIDGKGGATGTVVVNLNSDFTIPGPPANDNFANAATLSLSGSSTSVTGTNIDATHEPGEPDHVPGSPGTRKSVWYTWTPAQTGWYELDTCLNTDFDTAIAVYTGSAVDELDTIGQDDDGCGTLAGPSKLLFHATQGTVYRIAVDGYPFSYANEFGDFRLGLTTASAPPPNNDNFTQAFGLADTGKGSLDSSNEAATKEMDEANHGGDAGGHSVWYSWSAPKTGTATFDTCGSAIDTLIAAYTQQEPNPVQLVQQNDDTANCGPAGHGSRISFAATAGDVYYIAVDGKGGAEGAFELNWVESGGPASDHRSDAAPLEGASDSATADSTNASWEWGEQPHTPDAMPDMPWKSVWYRWTAPGDGPVTVDVCDSSYDTVLAAYEQGSNTHVADSDDDCGTDGTRSSITFDAVDGTTYEFAVGSHGDQPGGNVALDLTFTGTVGNDAPHCDDVTTSTPRGTSKSIQLSCTDTESDPLTLAVAGDPQHGTLTTVNQTTDRVTYIPDDGFTGQDSFTYTANDGSEDSNAATVSVSVTAPTDDGGTQQPGGNQPPGGGGETPTLTSSLAIAKTKLGALLKSGLPVSFTCNTVCSAKFELLMTKKLAKRLGIAAARPVVIGRGSGKVSASGTKKVAVKLTAKAKRRLKKVRRVTVTLRSTVTDAAGKKTVRTRKLTLKR
jgi:hypothetical protein